MTSQTPHHGSHVTDHASRITHHAFKVLGVRVHAVQIPDVIAQMERWIQERQQGRYIVAANAHVVTEGLRDPQFRAILNASALTIPDGMPLVWIARRRGFPLRERAYGPGLLRAFLESTQHKGYRHFFYGGAPTTLERLVTRLRAQFPKLEVCGYHSPPFRPLTPEEDRQVVDTINAARPDVLWVGLGCPKQERWMFEHRDRLQVPVMVGVGQAFDLFAGTKAQAPAWMRDHGLEWLFRLLQEPRRLWRRYLVQGPQFVFNVLLEEMGLKKFD